MCPVETHDCTTTTRQAQTNLSASFFGGGERSSVGRSRRSRDSTSVGSQPLGGRKWHTLRRPLFPAPFFSGTYLGEALGFRNTGHSGSRAQCSRSATSTVLVLYPARGAELFSAHARPEPAKRPRENSFSPPLHVENFLKRRSLASATRGIPVSLRPKRLGHKYFRRRSYNNSSGGNTAVPARVFFAFTAPRFVG